jgi:hypothetical protein
MKKEWTIRVINPIPYGSGRIPHGHLPGIWVEQLRRLGVLRVIKEYDGKHVTISEGQKLDGREVLEFPAPKGVDSKVWADMNSARMASFGIDVVAVPQWGGTEIL